MHVLLRTGIRDLIGIEAASFIFDADVDAIVTHINVEKHFLPVVELIAVLDRIYDDLIDKQLGTVRLVSFSIEVLRRKRVRLADQLIEPRSGAAHRNL
jgi:hypothetical protein